MGGSVQVENQFSHNNIDENANDQYKQGPKTDFGKDNPKRRELEGTDGGNVGTDIISPQEGASDDKSDEPPVLPSNPPLSGKLLTSISTIFGIKKQQEEEKKKKKRKRKEHKKRKRKNQIEIMTNYFLLQRTGLEICHLKWPANVSTMMVSPCTCATLFNVTFIN